MLIWSSMMIKNLGLTKEIPLEKDVINQEENQMDQLLLYMKYMMIKTCGRFYQVLFYHLIVTIVKLSSSKSKCLMSDKDLLKAMDINIWKVLISQLLTGR